MNTPSATPPKETAAQLRARADLLEREEENSRLEAELARATSAFANTAWYSLQRWTCGQTVVAIKITGFVIGKKPGRETRNVFCRYLTVRWEQEPTSKEPGAPACLSISWDPDRDQTCDADRIREKYPNSIPTEVFDRLADLAQASVKTANDLLASGVQETK